MRRNLYEFLKEVNDAPSKAERVRMLQAFNVKPLKTMLQLAFDKNIQLDVPEGAPPFKRDEREPIGMSSTDLMNETTGKDRRGYYRHQQGTKRDYLCANT